MEQKSPETREISLAAVRENGLILRYFTRQTRDMCLEAVRQNGLALRFVKDQTPEICEAAMIQNAAASRYVRESDGKQRFPYHISFSKPVGTRYKLSFDCMAEHAKDAIGQAEAEYRNCEITSVKRIDQDSWLADYELGDMVWWNDAKGGAASGFYALKELPDVAVDDDSVIYLASANGDEFCVRAKELTQFKPDNLTAIVNMRTLEIIGYAESQVEAQSIAMDGASEPVKAALVENLKLSNGTVLDKAWATEPIRQRQRPPRM